MTSAIQASQQKQEDLVQERDRSNEKLRRVLAEMEVLRHKKQDVDREYNHGEHKIK